MAAQEAAPEPQPANWLDKLVNDPLLFEFERVGMPGIWLPKTRLELSQMIRLQKEKHYPSASYDEKANMKWNMLKYHLERFKHMEKSVPF